MLPPINLKEELGIDLKAILFCILASFAIFIVTFGGKLSGDIDRYKKLNGNNAVSILSIKQQK